MLCMISDILDQERLMHHVCKPLYCICMRKIYIELNKNLPPHTLYNNINNIIIIRTVRPVSLDTSNKIILNAYWVVM
jgi:hypothetical protein